MLYVRVKRVVILMFLRQGQKIVLYPQDTLGLIAFLRYIFQGIAYWICILYFN